MWKGNISEQANVVANERHVMFSCIPALWYALQPIFLIEISEKYNFFKDLGAKSKILFLFNNINPFICES